MEGDTESWINPFLKKRFKLFKKWSPKLVKAITSSIENIVLSKIWKNQKLKGTIFQCPDSQTRSSYFKASALSALCLPEKIYSKASSGKQFLSMKLLDIDFMLDLVC